MWNLEKKEDDFRKDTVKNKDLILYLFSCVVFKHQNDTSCRITKEAKEKENEMFNHALIFLRELDKNGELFVDEKRQDI